MTVNAVVGSVVGHVANKEVELKDKIEEQQEEINVFNTTQKEKTFGESFMEWVNDEDKVCTDGNDDGKISVKDALVSVGKGLLSLIKAPFQIINSVKNAVNTVKDEKASLGEKALSVVSAALPIVATVGATALTILSGGAALPVLVGIGALVGIGEVGYGTYKALTAKTDGEAKQAFETMGNGALTFGLSAITAKSALKLADSAGVMGAKATGNPLKDVYTCLKVSPDAIKVSNANIATRLTGTVHYNSTSTRVLTTEGGADTNYRMNGGCYYDENNPNNHYTFYEIDGFNYQENPDFGYGKINPAMQYRIDELENNAFNGMLPKRIATPKLSIGDDLKITGLSLADFNFLTESK